MDPVRIRPFEISDAGSLFEAARESVDEVHPWLPWCHPDYAREEAESWIAMQLENWRKRTEFSFAIESEAGEFLGGCGINGIDALHKYANLGYWVRSSAAGGGVATAAVRQLRAWIFEITDLERLEIVVATGNTGSARVAQKAGALHEGTLRARVLLHDRFHDAHMYSFVRADA